MKLIRHKFALISEEKDVNLFATLVRTITTLVTIPSKSSIYFDTRIPWYGKRNHATQLFWDGLAQLEESGIYRRWFKYYNLVDVSKRLADMDKKLNLRRNGRQTNYFAMVIHSSANFASTGIDQWFPISIMSLEEIMIGCCVLFLGSIIAYFIENIKGQMTLVGKCHS